MNNKIILFVYKCKIFWSNWKIFIKKTSYKKAFFTNFSFFHSSILNFFKLNRLGSSRLFGKKNETENSNLWNRKFFKLKKSHFYVLEKENSKKFEDCIFLQNCFITQNIKNKDECYIEIKLESIF